MPAGTTPIVVPGMLTPGMLTPGMLTPGMLTPGMLTPGMLTPGVLAPGVLVPGVLAPGAFVHVVFVHGVRTSSAIWTHQVDAMRDLGHACTTVDLPGHGSRTNERFTLDSAVAAIDDAVRGFDTPPLLVGLSLGGYTSLAYAARHPGAVAGVVLSGCSTEIKGKPLSAYRRLAARVSQTLSRTPGTWHVVSDMLAALHGYSSLADLRRVRVPVWVVNGRWDILRFGERRVVAARPEARLHVIRRAGHDVNSHAPVAFTRILLDAAHHLAAVAPRALPAT